MNTKKERKQFEAWAYDVIVLDASELEWDEVNEQYVDDQLNAYWLGWVARVEWTERCTDRADALAVNRAADNDGSNGRAMKSFRYAQGHVGLTTFTVKDLRDHLAKYPDAMPVICTWEGTVCPVIPDSFEVHKWHYGQPKEETECLFLDAEDVKGYADESIA